MTLDVGSGNNPLEADVLLDIDVFGASDQRSKLPFKRLDEKKIICGDLQHLPFTDKTFDFISARHVIEHVDDPSLACNELSRVGKAGFIVSPLPFFEQVATGGWPGHKWYVWTRLDKKTSREVLCFEKILPTSYFKVCNCKEGAFVRRFFELGLKDNLCVLLHPLRVNESSFPADWTCYQWENEIDFEIRG